MLNENSDRRVFLNLSQWVQLLILKKYHKYTTVYIFLYPACIDRTQEDGKNVFFLKEISIFTT